MVSVLAVACAAPSARAVTSVESCRQLGSVSANPTFRFGDLMRLPDEVDPRNPATLAGSHFITFNQADGRVTAVNSAGTVRWRVGRSGDGPGEIARPFSTQIMGVIGAQWIAAQADRVVVFDGRTFFEFTESGALTRQWRATSVFGDSTRVSRRIRVNEHHVYLDLMRAPHVVAGTAGRRIVEVFASDTSSAQRVAEIELPALPSAPGVGMADGPAQAKPSWDLRGSCLVLSDGSSSRLIFVDVGSGQRDTVDIGLPEWFVDVALANQQTQGLVQGGRPMPEPSARARISDLTLSADGIL